MNSVSYLFSFGAIFAAYYAFMFVGGPVTAARSIVKTLPVLLFAVASFFNEAWWQLTFALLFCAIGDLLLSRKGERNFIFGLAAFLFGHLLYTCLFSGIIYRERFELLTVDNLAAAMIITALAIFVISRLWANLASMRIPVIIYAMAIGSMAVAAKIANLNQIALAGVLLFIISDTLLGYETFIPNLERKLSSLAKFRPWAVWITYAMGQAMIVFGLLWPNSTPAV